MKKSEKSTTAGSLMTPAPMVASPGNSLRDSVRRMLEADVRHLPVVDADGHLVGMLSDRDVRAAVGDPGEWLDSGADEEADELDVYSVMSVSPAATTPETPLTELVETLIRDHVGALPVVDSERRLLGILSYVDVLRTVAPEAG